MKTGILLHVYNLLAADWEHIVWGDPVHDALGVGAKLFECMLAELPFNEVAVILYDGPSHKDGMSEGYYTKKFLLKKLDELDQFPRFRRLLEAMPAEQYQAFRQAVNNIIVGEPIENTRDEIMRATTDFKSIGAIKVIHIAAASHAPRCILYQAQVREEGLIPSDQHWYTVASDTCFAGTHANDTIVIEPPHRADDPLLGLTPTLPQVLRPLYRLPAAGRREFVRLAAIAMQDATGAASRASDVPILR